MKSVKSPKQILLSTEYWYKAGEILVSEYKTIFWESKENLETFYTDSPNFVISYVFVLKTVKGLNRIFCVTEYWLENAKFAPRMQSHFSGKVRLTLKLSKNFLSILEFLINLFRSLWKVSVYCYYWFLEFFDIEYSAFKNSIGDNVTLQIE